MSIYCNAFKQVMDSIHIFISNVKGYQTRRTIGNVKVDNIYSIYHSYNRPLEVGISSYDDLLTTTINYNNIYN